MKLIIDIPEEDYKRITKFQNVSGCGNMLTNSIINATPFDDVKAEIRKLIECARPDYFRYGMERCLDILNDIGNEESEDKE